MSAPATVLLTSSPVPYKVLRDPRAEYRIGAGVQETKFSVSVLASDLVAFLTFASGSTPTVIDLGGGVTVTRHIPASDPDFPTLLLTDIDGASAGGWTPTNSVTRRNWSHVKLALTFSSVPFPTDGSTPFMTVQIRRAAEVVTLAGVNYAFSGGPRIGADAGITVPTMAYMVTVYQMTAMDDDLIGALQGKVNSATLTLRSQVCNPGTVRFDGADIQETRLADGEFTYQRTMQLMVRPVPWNMFLRPDGVWAYAYKGGVVDPANLAYAPADLAPLFA